jgi:hypothetical protein
MKKPEEEKPGQTSHMPSCQKVMNEVEAEAEVEDGVEIEVEVEVEAKIEVDPKFEANHSHEESLSKVIHGSKDILTIVIIMATKREIVESLDESNPKLAKIRAMKMVRPWSPCHPTLHWLLTGRKPVYT